MSVEGEHHEKAVELLKAAPASVKLVVRYTPKVGFGRWWLAGNYGDVDNRDILVSDFASFPSFCHSCKDVNFLNNSSMLTIENIGQNRCKDLSKNKTTIESLACRCWRRWRWGLTSRGRQGGGKSILKNPSNWALRNQDRSSNMCECHKRHGNQEKQGPTTSLSKSRKMILPLLASSWAFPKRLPWM